MKMYDFLYIIPLLGCAWSSIAGVELELRRGGGGSGSRTDIGSEQDGDVLFEIEGAKTFDYVDGFIQTLRDTDDNCGDYVECEDQGDQVTCCPPDYKCCPMPSAITGIGCCSYSNGVCCPGGVYCCPEDFICTGKGSCAFLKPEHVTGTPISEAPTLVTGETVPPTWSSTETAPSTWSSTETASLI
ncbi:uncharacterized protein LOC111700170 [Eurytemora carolleeae]|uniref:uncharacterized protein LOC111700170 n=1 Tax=Eurytemora carolleeae TaxID=1294199 RepID=UPI000C78C583|nr:uncharacterized protein LOC111700170 [Eurytemora carolleeae]|eukprot:XP_023326769.1 uncharacterized protein LOC111700170 [Eurytemora affinis]